MATPTVWPTRSSPQQYPVAHKPLPQAAGAKRGHPRAKLEQHMFINTARARGDRRRDCRDRRQGPTYMCVPLFLSFSLSFSFSLSPFSLCHYLSLPPSFPPSLSLSLFSILFSFFLTSMNHAYDMFCKSCLPSNYQPIVLSVPPSILCAFSGFCSGRRGPPRQEAHGAPTP